MQFGAVRSTQGWNGSTVAFLGHFTMLKPRRAVVWPDGATWANHRRGYRNRDGERGDHVAAALSNDAAVLVEKGGTSVVNDRRTAGTVKTAEVKLHTLLTRPRDAAIRSSGQGGAGREMGWHTTVLTAVQAPLFICIHVPDAQTGNGARWHFVRVLDGGSGSAIDRLPSSAPSWFFHSATRPSRVCRDQDDTDDHDEGDSAHGELVDRLSSSAAPTHAGGPLRRVDSTLLSLRRFPGIGASPAQSLPQALSRGSACLSDDRQRTGNRHLSTTSCLTMYTLSPTMESGNSFAGTCLHAPYPAAPSHTTQFETAHLSAMSAPSTLLQQADSPTLKRAFSTPNSSFPSKKPQQSFTHCPDRPSTSPPTQRRPSNTGTRCPRLAPPTKTRKPSMVQTSARSFMPMPSFGAVFGGEIHNTGLQHLADANGGNVALPASSGNTTTGAPFSSFHMHRDSRDSNSTASSDNSPTTTISTMDSSSVTDPSPGVSPESPLAKTAAPSSFVADFRSRRTEPSPGDSSPNNFFELQRPTTPAKKPRNLKNLGINTTSSLSNLRAQTPAPIVVPPKERNSSAPPSPLFIKPPTPPKRRPSNLSLTISTPGSTENKPVRLVIPSTPSFNRPALRHFQSSPSLPLYSQSTLPMGGMQLPPLRPIVTNPSGLSEVPFEMEEEEDQEQNFDIPQSREEKPAAYPNGPICIYESGVYLYFEPTVEQATTFDVIINVASEVKNPFLSPATDSQKDIDARRVDGPPAESVDFATLSHRPKPTTTGRQDSSPTTPKAAPTMHIVPPRDVTIDGKTYKTPEYIHMPWEHNTDIVPDLYKLVKMMDDNVQQGKRVLIHCQCGVSRSASLIVAYGLYKDPQMSVQEAYDRAKKRSKWIGPNMNLIMQLQEFRNGLLRQNESRSYHNQGFGRRSGGLSTGGANRYSPFDRETSSGPRTPQTAPLPPDCDISMQRASTGNIMAISPGPLSAPTGTFAPGFRRSWDSSQTHFGLSSQPTSQPSPTTTPYVDPKGHIVPVLSIIDDDLSPAQSQVVHTSEVAQPEQKVMLQLPSAPNFSRQLPLRTLENHTEASLPSSREVHLGPPPPMNFSALKSPAVARFNLSSFAPREQSVEPDIMSPVKTSFDIDPWPQGYDLDSQPSEPPYRGRDIPAPLPLLSPRSTEFHMTSLSTSGIDESYGLLSPRATSFEQSGSGQPQNSTIDDLDLEPEITSPVATHFPKDIFGSADDVLDDELKSPRAMEFHMTPLKPRIADDDPFGLTSPTRAEFPGNPFDKPSLAAFKDDEGRRPSFQAIMPPSHQTFNGFASLDGTAQTQSFFQPSVSLSALNTKQNPEVQSRIDSLSSPHETQISVPMEPHVPGLETSPKVVETPRAPDHAFLSTPAKAIRTRFSSPNMREQRKLHKLQTEIESKLPKPPVAQHAVDDIDALMSPRAEEFTRNPFHVDLNSTGDDTSPASSNETIKDGRNGHDWNEPPPRQWTPEKATVDPRSPVQTGSNPIVRNIWDVL
ncbi:uncharacterized protein K460DRAFT_356665 [Cucurbitaria berberidis CBS 394.84]|uniref:protein-tyrosine-phosphatase n=1 Tax=Cucurbitaria berberidis CBS 394.84 TaxID=1168544 RepID=A0A9P4L5D8_9PLEO|nr:uncharacterized protein K460DRAFT_356665 [Cucurbitaria berberidis CBS 394.84]KAF1842856.1 hypothetical protein K460DRAFT_356665 [Cucurbitaria berberidis CBS 394.84]